MAYYKYVGTESTRVQKVKWGEKVRLENGDVVDTYLDHQYLLSCKFVACDKDGNLDWEIRDGSKEAAEKKTAPVNQEWLDKIDESELKEMTIDESELKEMTIDESELKETTIDESELKEMTIDESELKEMTIDEAKKYLDDNGVKYHPATGIKKLLIAIEKHKEESKA